MEAWLTIIISLIAVGVLVYMLLKKNDIKMTLISLGVILMYLAILMGKHLKVSVPTGSVWLDPFQDLVDKFTTTLVGPGFIILILGGYNAYMNQINANQVTIQALTKPAKKIKSVYLLVPIVFLMGNLLSLVIPSAANLAIILLATLYPVLRAAGMSRLSAAAVIATSATIVPTPLGSDNVAMAAQLKMPVTEYAFRYHAIVSVPTILAMAVIHYFWQKYQDKKNPENFSYDAELKAQEEDEPKKTADAPKEYKGFTKFIYGILPLLPIILLLLSFLINMITKQNLSLSVQIVTMISFLIAIIVDAFSKKNLQAVLKDTNVFFDGMGSVMSIVALLVAAQVFVEGLTSIGIINLIQNSMKQMTSSGVILPIIMVLFTAVIVLLSGSGVALIFAMIPLIIPLSKAAGITPQALSIPIQLSGNLLRAVSPVAAVILIVAGTTKLSPVQIIKRTWVPMVFGVIMVVIMSLIIF
ncbi:C4-dicarboxylate transporter DcuC [Xylocopilactobacillus apis]|uniref:C4-dicarboxylate ABC transporter n=1 Tax=Xylocopilactobacillus apis TaxID=2932183 RepID=A0AAU9DTT3_9LACO|nr:C4-dicarboxylate transporter DcuC [Xylocopilactobacillus apis]BDR57213.1 C4-dicarboxylate ABC transporter [Xylocopilactobacillus apis]